MSRLRTRYSGPDGRYRLLLTLAAVAVFAVGLYQLGRFGYAEYHVQAARAAVERGDLTAARPHLDVALRERPDNGQVAFLAARAARRAGEYPAAARHLDRAGKLGWAPDAVELERLLLRGETGDFLAVADKLRAVELANHPDRNLVREVLAPGYLAGYQLGDAYEVLQRWVGDDPDNLRARLMMFDVARRLEVPQLAMESARAAVGIAPDDEAARLACGQILIDQHQPAEALPHFRWLAERRPDDTAVALGLARTRKELGEGGEAARVLDDLLRRHPDHPQGLAEKGSVDMQAGRPADALPSLRKAAALTPGDPDVLYNLAVCLAQNGLDDEAKVWRERHERSAADLREMTETIKAVVKDPRNADLRFKAGTLLMRNGHEREGVRWLRSALDADPAHQPTRAALEEHQKKSGGW